MAFELKSRNADRDAHSTLASVVPSSAWRLVQALATMQDADGEITIEGFDDKIVPLSDEEFSLLSQVDDESGPLRERLGVRELLPIGPGGYHVQRTRPTINIAGISSGYTGQGMKTIIPHSATTKLDVRLVPDQDPDEVQEAISRHLATHGFEDIFVERLSAVRPSRTDVNHEFVQLATKMASKAFGRSAQVYPRVVGSGPDYYFTGIMGLPSVIVPYGNADANTHSPNENMDVQAFLNGIKCSTLLFASFGDEGAGEAEEVD